MKYTEEEKEVVSTAKEIVKKKYGSIMHIEISDMKIILNILDKQQKEIEEKDKQVEVLDEAYRGVITESKKWFDIAKNSIPKEAIREKIEEIKRKRKLYWEKNLIALKNNNGEYKISQEELDMNNISIQLYGAIQVLKELLGE